MNIFATSKCPVKSAKYLDDKRVVKMCLESAQMLATAAAYHGGAVTYKPTHKNHPCTVWAGQSRKNYLWLHSHFCALLSEYTSRYGKVHGCAKYKYELFQAAKAVPDGNITKFANCAANASVGVSYKHVEDVHMAYKLYLSDRWETDKRVPTWYGI